MGLGASLKDSSDNHNEDDESELKRRGTQSEKGLAKAARPTKLTEEPTPNSAGGQSRSRVRTVSDPDHIDGGAQARSGRANWKASDSAHIEEGTQDLSLPPNWKALGLPDIDVPLDETTPILNQFIRLIRDGLNQSHRQKCMYTHQALATHNTCLI